eukprot:CAMPEP_0201627624 /NCGR_PEP_ID=MMETSP0493-20130528/2765_1 /ASSEMBLY_ACC=CAM_ASM_000838 /TAXON_ID=420259 /ORGANISM="Thalassiosira gravida, Strain GMp14c1" /LENGTH=45 /DNA_ID= /DNA_START= /DNA_END= /DNA_ORIENTATION=
MKDAPAMSSEEESVRGMERSARNAATKDAPAMSEIEESALGMERR